MRKEIIAVMNSKKHLAEHLNVIESKLESVERKLDYLFVLSGYRVNIDEDIKIYISRKGVPINKQQDFELRY